MEIISFRAVFIFEMKISFDAFILELCKDASGVMVENLMNMLKGK